MAKRKKTPQNTNRDHVSINYKSLNALLAEELKVGNEAQKLETVTNEIKPPEITQMETQT